MAVRSGQTTGGRYQPGRGGGGRQRRRPRNPLTRRQRLDRDPLLNPSVQLSGANLLFAARGLANIETRPQLKAINQEITSTKRQGAQLSKNAAGYYQQLAAEEAKSVDRQRALADRANAALKGISDETGQANQQAGADAQSVLDRDAALRGEGLEGGAREKLAAELAARQGVAAGTGQAFRSAGVLQGAAGESLSDAIRRAGQVRGGETQQEIQRRTANTLGQLNEKRRDVRSSRGQLATKYLTNLRQTAYENLVTQQGLGIKQREITADAAEAALNARLALKRIRSTDKHNRALEDLAADRNRLTARGQDVTARGQDISSSDRRQAERGRNRRSRQENRQQNRNRRTSDRSQRGVGAIRQALDVYRRTGDMSNAAGRLRRNDYNVEIINAAAGLYQNGYISPNTVRALRQMGVYVPREWLPPRRRRRR